MGRSSVVQSTPTSSPSSSSKTSCSRTRRPSRHLGSTAWSSSGSASSQTATWCYYATGDAGEAVDDPVVVANGTYVGGAALADTILLVQGRRDERRQGLEVLAGCRTTRTFRNIRDLVDADGHGGPEASIIWQVATC
ncbi:hypothetical protein CTA2_9086 [Colletotrichum tanaceti]|uniref:Uncharacterized protein n=1 Tax=Colletotrichum tanaceti TaxID=1306861 RepID=A0A4U6X1P9_9PEZI|nr:hypothetical protein CTA2_9086 [Colletotrichum tanaceti]TKW49302.1 hypothetical protein CTA1_9538 [Colletotrichum tanaceti]